MAGCNGVWKCGCKAHCLHSFICDFDELDHPAGSSLSDVQITFILNCLKTIHSVIPLFVRFQYLVLNELAVIVYSPFSHFHSFVINLVVQGNSGVCSYSSRKFRHCLQVKFLYWCDRCATSVLSSHLCCSENLDCTWFGFC